MPVYNCQPQVALVRVWIHKMCSVLRELVIQLALLIWHKKWGGVVGVEALVIVLLLGSFILFYH